ncbi:TetR/AcrR family transcriptional regulator, partial [Pseudomonas amygdali]|uniref:TetR/AcrR family transcriptional regulator n=1 Tax=Pseudomonas amygdali TaxID=47877 RepID=UPI001F2C0F50
MKTRDRILECALTLFNQQGEPNVSTLEIANEMGIRGVSVFLCSGWLGPAVRQALVLPARSG